MLAKRKNAVRKRSLMTTGIWVIAALSVALVMGQAQADGPAADAAVKDAVLGQSIQTISFKKDMPIKDALRMLAQMYEKNIVPSAGVDGVVTVTNLYDVTFEEAMQAILGTNKYEVKGNFIKVYTNEEYMADEDRFEDYMFTLYYINAEEAEKLAKALLSKFGTIAATTVVEGDMEAGKGGDTLAVHDRLVVRDYPEVIESIRGMLSEVDVEPMQVLLEVTILKAQLTESTEFGIDWSNVPGVASLSNRGVDWQDGQLKVGISIDNITGLITALENITDTTILANPKILALNKQAGNLTIGTETGYRDSTTQNQSGSTTQAVEFLKTGTLLTFRPFIGRDGLIRMEIAPEQSSGGLQEDGFGSLPFKDTTSIVTNVMVKDGQTIVLGGLFQEDTTLNRGQIPVMGDLPGVGQLFRNTNDSSIRSELIILLTPHIIETPQEADGAGRLEDVLRLSHEIRENLTWLSRARIDEWRYSDAVKFYSDGRPEKALALLNSPLNIQRSYLDQVRLKERIIRETKPDEVQNIERIMLRAIEKEESDKWFRR